MPSCHYCKLHVLTFRMGQNESKRVRLGHLPAFLFTDISSGVLYAAGEFEVEEERYSDDVMR